MTANTDASAEVQRHDVRAVLGRALFTAEEVAEALAVSKTLVRQLTLTGDIPCRRIGRLVRYTASDIEEFVHRFDAQGYPGSR
jgi:excisionase family DNA binding protein